METRPRKAGNRDPQVPLEEVPKATQAETGIAAIAANNPQAFVLAMNEKRFNPNDILDPFCKAVVETVITQSARNASTDVRVLFERVRERLPHVEFYQISNLLTEGSVASALPEMMDIVRDTAKRRGLMTLAAQVSHDIKQREQDTLTLISGFISEAEGLARELNPPKLADTSALLMNALDRYATGDDSTLRIRTGFEKLDNLTPTRFGDFMVIGGETKSGKTMLALNIIANIIQHEHNQPDSKLD